MDTNCLTRFPLSGELDETQEGFNDTYVHISDDAALANMSNSINHQDRHRYSFNDYHVSHFTVCTNGEEDMIIGIAFGVGIINLNKTVENFTHALPPIGDVAHFSSSSICSDVDLLPDIYISQITVYSSKDPQIDQLTSD